MKYTLKELQTWAKEGERVSSQIALELIEDNHKLRKLILKAIELINEEDPVLLRTMDKNQLLNWKKVAEFQLNPKPKDSM